MKTLDAITEIGPIEQQLVGALRDGRERLHEHEIYSILDALGFRTPATLFVTRAGDIESAGIDAIPGDTVVCKLISGALTHRFEHGGVQFVERNGKRLEETFNEFVSIADSLGIPLDGMLIAERIPGNDSLQNKLLLSLRQDPSFGPIVFLGLGGVGTEVYKQYIREGRDLVIRAASCVADYEGTERELSNTLFYPIITGRTRIKPDPKVSENTIHEALRRFALLAERFSPLYRNTPVTIEELEVNPIQITGSGELVPLDALIRISGNKYTMLTPKQSGIRSLLEPKSVLVIGASASKMNAGRIIQNNILKGGVIPKERIHILHPDADEIDGCRAYRSIGDIPDRVDMTVFTIPANERSASLLEEIIERESSDSIILISGGFGETKNGRVLDARIRDAIIMGRKEASGGVVVNGPNCLGIVSRPGGYNTFFIPEHKLPFNGRHGERTACISQSGAYLVTLVSNMGQLLNPKYMITYGNQMDLTVTDYLIYLKDDPEIDVFCLYIEGFKPYDGERFLKVAREIVRSGKKIIMYKTGRTKAGAAAVASHTASMAGDFEVLKRILTDAGVIMPETLNETEDTIKVFALLSGKRVTGTRVGIYANAGFECSVAADRLYSMSLARFSDETVQKLHDALPTDIIDVNNPVDATPQTNVENYRKCIEALIEDQDVDCIMAAVVPPTPFMETLPAGDGHGEDISSEGSYPNVTTDLFNRTTKPMVVSVDSGGLYDPAVHMMEKAGIPVFRKMDRAMKALDVFLVHSQPRRQI